MPAALVVIVREPKKGNALSMFFHTKFPVVSSTNTKEKLVSVAVTRSLAAPGFRSIVPSYDPAR